MDAKRIENLRKKIEEYTSEPKILASKILATKRGIGYYIKTDNSEE